MSEIEELAKLQFTIDEIEVIIEKKIRGNKQNELAYNRGRLKAQAIVRKQILQMASDGNTTAAKQFLDLVEQSEEWED